MRITFIDPTESIVNYGLRAMVNHLLNYNHDVKMIFLNQPVIRYDYDYPESIYSDLLPLVKDSDIVGFSFVSNYYGQAKKITRFIKDNINIPIIWGGIHAMAAPDQCLQDADMIGLGEGETPLLELMDKMQSGYIDYSTKGIWFKRNGAIIKNEIARINPDIDSYSLPLYDNDREYIRRENRIVKMTNDIRKDIICVPTNYYKIESAETYTYLTLSARGCPSSCTYCCNNLFRSLYGDKKSLLRRRSNNNLIGELISAREKMPFINLVEIFDDDFICTKVETIAEFSGMYKKHINLPFRCNFRPESVSEEKMNLLADAGLISVEMGLQSASANTNKIYKRHFSRNIFLKAVQVINKHDSILPHYDIIVDNPLESHSDIQQTLRFLAELPTPFRIPAYSLTFFPGTHLYEYAKEHNLIRSEEKDIYSKKDFVVYEYKQPYIKFLLFYIRSIGCRQPLKKKIFSLLTSKFALDVFDSFIFTPFWIAVMFGKRLFSKAKNKNVALIPG
ncbi:MAG: radical SAM protein [bacterium]